MMENTVIPLRLFVISPISLLSPLFWGSRTTTTQRLSGWDEKNGVLKDVTLYYLKDIVKSI